MDERLEALGREAKRLPWLDLRQAADLARRAGELQGELAFENLERMRKAGAMLRALPEDERVEVLALSGIGKREASRVMAVAECEAPLLAVFRSVDLNRRRRPRP